MGHYFIMRFDSSAATQAEVRRSLGLDPRMIRFSVVKLGDKLAAKQGIESMEKYDGGGAHWTPAKGDEELFAGLNHFYRTQNPRDADVPEAGFQY